MRYKASFLSGLAAGYVLGARAGRERYEQIRRSAQTTWQNPKVQRAAGTVGTQATHVVGSAARVAKDKGRTVTDKVGDKIPARISDKLPNRFRHQQGDEWRPYAHTGQTAQGAQNGLPGTPGSTSP
jgi:hypothetical protein